MQSLFFRNHSYNSGPSLPAHNYLYVEGSIDSRIISLNSVFSDSEIKTIRVGIQNLSCINIYANIDYYDLYLNAPVWYKN